MIWKLLIYGFIFWSQVLFLALLIMFEYRPHSCIQGAEEKLGIFLYNNKRLYYKTRLILIFKNKQPNTKTNTKQ